MTIESTKALWCQDHAGNEQKEQTEAASSHLPPIDKKSNSTQHTPNEPNAPWETRKRELWRSWESNPVPRAETLYRITARDELLFRDAKHALYQMSYTPLGAIETGYGPVDGIPRA